MIDEQTRDKILKLLDGRRNMTVATLRPDGWPQASTVGYANDGLTLHGGARASGHRAHRGAEGSCAC